MHASPSLRNNIWFKCICMKSKVIKTLKEWISKKNVKKINKVPVCVLFPGSFLLILLHWAVASLLNDEAIVPNTFTARTFSDRFCNVFVADNTNLSAIQSREWVPDILLQGSFSEVWSFSESKSPDFKSGFPRSHRSSQSILSWHVT